MSGGEHSWKRVPFDTNMVWRWMDGDSDFQAPLKALVRRLAKHKAKNLGLHGFPHVRTTLPVERPPQATMAKATDL